MEAKLVSHLFDLFLASRGSQRSINARQASRLAGMISFARAHSPYYRKLYGNLPLNSSKLHELPIVSKPDLMANFNDWVTDPKVTISDVTSFIEKPNLVGQLYQEKYAVWTTSGITGEPGIFIHDSDALKLYTALAISRGVKTWISPKDVLAFLGRGIRVAIVITTGGHWAGTVVKELVGSIHPSLGHHFRAFSVQTPLNDLVNELNEFQPTVLVSYPTAVQLLAHKQMTDQLKIFPTLIATIAECLFPTAREQIALAFKCQVRNLYAASEFLGIAFSCNHNQLHLNADWLILEPVDKNHQPVPPGQTSHTALLTNLVNRVQPIIRYDLGDSITVISDPCLCGGSLPSIEIHGRQDDILYLHAPDGDSIPIMPMALAAAVEEVPGIQRYQIIQTGPASLSLRIEELPGSNELHVRELVSRNLDKYLKTQGLPSVQIEVSQEPPMRDPVSGKFRQICRYLPTLVDRPLL